MFIQLRKLGAMEAHLDAKEAEARAMFAELTKDGKTLPGTGVLDDLSLERSATELVYAALIEFPNGGANG